MTHATNQNLRFLNRDIIKYIAMATMLLNHIAHIFLEPGTLLFEVFLNIGYFTAITMCYFLVEGYGYTHSKKKYALRLLLFAIISQIPFSLAFSKKGTLSFVGFNMMFTLLLCLGVIWIMENVKHESWKVLGIAGIILVSTFCDWPMLAPAFTVLFVRAGNSFERKKKAFILSMVLFGVFNFTGELGWSSLAENIRYTLFSMAGMALAGVCILYFYNGERMKRGRTFSKWFFYLFYPLHLLILVLIRYML